MKFEVKLAGPNTHVQTTSPKDNSQGHQINEHMWKHFKSATGFISVITILDPFS